MYCGQDISTHTWPNLSEHLNILLYIINKSFFTLSFTIVYNNELDKSRD